ncbi:MAG: DUF4124 domain-containing protein [Pseudomonadota bacterium]
MNTRIILAVMLATGSLPCVSEITRSVDKDGNVTFSDQPVPGSVETTPVVIDTPPAPSKQEINESERQARDMINRANLSQQKRDSSTDDRAARIQAAQMNLDATTAHLREVEVVRAEDRQALVGGGTKLRPEYLQRVQEAEQQVMGAQRQLDAAKMAH